MLRFLSLSFFIVVMAFPQPSDADEENEPKNWYFRASGSYDRMFFPSDDGEEVTGMNSAVGMDIGSYRKWKEKVLIGVAIDVKYVLIDLEDDEFDFDIEMYTTLIAASTMYFPNQKVGQGPFL